MNSRIYTSIYQLKNIAKLEEIGPWISNTHKSPVKHSKKHEEAFKKLSDDEKNYIYRWNYIGPVQKLPVVVNGEEISFIEATAEIEYAKRRIFDENKQFLRKKDRVNTEIIQVIFFELDGEFYVIVQESKQKHIDRILKLIGSNYLEGPNWMLSGDLFNWLFYLFAEKNGVITSKMSISSISGFTGMVSDNENIVSSKSMKTMKLIATKAFISTGGILNEVSIILRDDDNCSICCRLDNQCRSVVSVSESKRFTSPNGLSESENFLLYIYTYLIPLLREKFLQDKQNFTTDKKQKFAKKIGIEVIDDIMKENNIKPSELLVNKAK